MVARKTVPPRLATSDGFSQSMDLNPPGAVLNGFHQEQLKEIRRGRLLMKKYSLRCPGGNRCRGQRLEMDSHPKPVWPGNPRPAPPSMRRTCKGARTGLCT